MHLATAQQHGRAQGYFPTVGLKLLRGRVFTEQEVSDRRHVAVVNHTLVQKFFGTDDPIGREIMLKDKTKWAEVL